MRFGRSGIAREEGGLARPSQLPDLHTTFLRRKVGKVGLVSVISIAVVFYSNEDNSQANFVNFMIGRLAAIRSIDGTGIGYFHFLRRQ